MRQNLTRFLCSALVCVTTACSFKNQSELDAMVFGPEFQQSSLIDEGISPNKILEMSELISDNPDFEISSALIVYQNTLVFEHYFADQGPNDLHTTRSAGKAITSALVGIAIQEEYLDGTEAKVLSFFPEYEGELENWDERKRDITVGQLLSMTSGVRNNEDNMYPSADWVKFYLEQPLASAPGEAFSYSTSGVVTLGSILLKASGQRVPAFADQYLFGPLGITEYRWPITNSRDNQGLAMTGGGLNLTSRDMAKFGLLYLNQGRWGDRQIIFKDWIKQSTTKQATSDLYGEDFGYLWRMIDREVKGTAVRSFEAWGNGGQFIMVFPGLDVVVVWTGENYGRFPEMERPFQLTEDYILPTYVAAKKVKPTPNAKTSGQNKTEPE